MKTILIILTGILFSFSAISQEVNCKKFKVGTFYYPTLENKMSVRKDSTQESYNNGKLEMLWKVKWLNDCEYEMTCQAVYVDPYPIKKGDRIMATIIKTDSDCFTTSLIFYNAENPKGQVIPSGEMCIKKK